MKIALICYAVRLPNNAKEVPKKMAECVPEGAPVSCYFLKENAMLPEWGSAGQMLGEFIGRGIGSTPAMSSQEERAAQEAANNM